LTTNYLATGCPLQLPRSGYGDGLDFLISYNDLGGRKKLVTKKEAVRAESPEDKAIDSAQARSNFITATKDELAKVVWPSRQQLISESVAVILMVILVSTVIYFVDQIFGWITKQPFLFG
jgi:preprotein translocase subunit SecE